MSLIKTTLADGAEGFQRATGKPFGRLARGEILAGKISFDGMNQAGLDNPACFASGRTQRAFRSPSGLLRGPPPLEGNCFGGKDFA